MDYYRLHTDLITRSSQGILAGVCAGLARRWQMDPWVVRIVLLLMILVFGTGIVLYLLAWIALPSEENAALAYQKRVLGVCARVAVHLDIDVGIIRFIALFLALGSFGATVIGYLILHFVVPQCGEQLQ